MNKEHNNENKNDEEDTLTLAKLFSNWYVGAVVGFALVYCIIDKQLNIAGLPSRFVIY